MSEALYRDLKRLQEQKRRDWEAKAAPAKNTEGAKRAQEKPKK